MPKWYHQILHPDTALFQTLKSFYLIAIQGRRRKLKARIAAAPEPLKINLGAAYSDYDGWIATDYPAFDIANPNHWAELMGNRRATHFLAEHVLEHLSYGQVDVALQMAFQYLKPGGVFRIAVPDANHPSNEYFHHCKPVEPNGKRELEQHDHKNFWDHGSLANLLRRNGYRVELVEYYDANGQLTALPQNEERGIVRRAASRNYQSVSLPGVAYSSLIIDGIKP